MVNLSSLFEEVYYSVVFKKVSLYFTFDIRLIV